MASDSEDNYDDGYSSEKRGIKINKQELDELKMYFEMNQNEVFSKATQVLFDILECEKLGWKLSFVKTEVPLIRSYFSCDEPDAQIISLGLDKIALPDHRINHQQFANFN